MQIFRTIIRIDKDVKIKNYRQQPVIRNCRAMRLLMSVHLAIFRVTRQASAHESATAHSVPRSRTSVEVAFCMLA
jgi:hypothetical protein